MFFVYSCYDFYIKNKYFCIRISNFYILKNKYYHIRIVFVSDAAVQCCYSGIDSLIRSKVYTGAFPLHEVRISSCIYYYYYYYYIIIIIRSTPPSRVVRTYVCPYCTSVRTYVRTYVLLSVHKKFLRFE